MGVLDNLCRRMSGATQNTARRSWWRRSLSVSLRLGTRTIVVGPRGVKSRSSVAACVDERQESAPEPDMWGRREVGDGRHLPLALMGERDWRRRGGGARHLRRGGGVRRQHPRGARHQHEGALGGCGGGCTVEGGRGGGASTGGCGEMTGLGFGGSGALKKKDSSNGH
jgi:hypothetical protein